MNGDFVLLHLPFRMGVIECKRLSRGIFSSSSVVVGTSSLITVKWMDGWNAGKIDCGVTRVVDLPGSESELQILHYFVFTL